MIRRAAAATLTPIGRALRWIGGHELATLLAFAVAFGGIWAFAWLAFEVGRGDTHVVDRLLLFSLRTTGDSANPVGPAWMEEAVRDITALGSVVVLAIIVLFAAGHLVLQGKGHAAVLLLATCLGGGLASTLLKESFSRPRPDLVAHGARVMTASFPSGHSMMSAVIYLTVGALLARVEPKRRVKAFLLLSALAVTFLVGASRVYLGVHWPSDVLAGWMAGVTWAAASWALTRRLQRKGQVESDAPVAR